MGIYVFIYVLAMYRCMFGLKIDIWLENLKLVTKMSD